MLFTINFINSMVEESKYCSDLMKKHFNKELVMTKKDIRALSTKCWICDDAYADGDVKVTDHCLITGKYRSSADRVCNIKVMLIHKIPVIFHNLKIMIHILLCKN